METIEYELAHRVNEMHNLLEAISKFKGLDHTSVRMKCTKGMTLANTACSLNYIKRRRHSTIAKIIKLADELKK